MLDQVKEEVQRTMKTLPLDTMAVGLIDFSHKKFESFQMSNDLMIDQSRPIYFDLASLTKALTNASIRVLRPKLFDDNLELVLNHSAGLFWWGRLSHDSWKQQILSYNIKKSETVYSDFSSLRTMLEIEKKARKSIYDICQDFHDEETLNWLKLKDRSQSPITGYRGGREIRGTVHDDNAFVIARPVSHAGLFSSVDGLCRSLINLESLTGLMDYMLEQKKTVSSRFICGFDTPSNLDDSFAGIGCGPKTFGHLGFTGTGVWIDPQKRIGHIIMGNITRDGWFFKKEYNLFRKKLASKLWTLC